MRNKFASILIEKYCEREDFIFLTGDLGFNALEMVRDKMGNRFINAGVAEQNMVGVASGFAKQGFKVITYSIAPFAVFRCLEQIRVDVCLHKLPVFVVGNGGGYGYGIMGGTHHAIEDLACLSCLPNMNCYAPSFYNELESSIDTMFSDSTPAYLRLGLGKENPYPNNNPKQLNPLTISNESKTTIVGLGPILHNCIEAVKNTGLEIDMFSTYKLPLNKLNEEFKESVKKTKKLIIVEEHASRGGLAENIAILLFEEGITDVKLVSHHADGYPNGLYGSQKYHQMINHLDVPSIESSISTINL